jgi:hypothetical protein
MEATTPPDTSKKKGLIWWRLIVGLYLGFVAIRSTFFPSPNLPDFLKASNPTQRLGMYIAFTMECWLSVWLIYSGFRPLRRRNLEKLAANDRSPNESAGG